MQYIDIGVNLLNRQFRDDREAVIQRSISAAVSPLIVTGTNLRASQQSADFAAKHPGTIFSTAGVHPHDAKSCDSRTISDLRRIASSPQVVAIGECGLDYDRDFSPRDVQRRMFEAQLVLATELAMPLFLHERAASADFVALLEQHRDVCSSAVVHCFTGSKAELETYLKLGCYIGITGWICDERRGMHLQQIVKLIPKNKLIIETDAPFLLPRNMPLRPVGGRNEPAYLPHIAAHIAKCRGEAVEEVAFYTTQNAKQFFHIGA